jgi:hypothetical protein
MTSRAWLNVLPLILLLLTPVGCRAGDLKTFTSDGCSSFPNGTPKQNDLWLACCIVHDGAYWSGGTYAERLAADRELRSCVADVGEPEIAVLMMDGVRVGGTPYLPTRFRWGFGWPYPRGYKALTAKERLQVKEMLAEEKP